MGGQAGGPAGIDRAAVEAEPLRPPGPRKAYEKVADRIRERIFSAAVKTGERLPTERDLAAQFGVSRVVVREAVRALELSGLVSVKKGAKGGIFIAQDPQRPINDSIGNLLARGQARLSDLFEVRMLIEPYAAARVASVGTAKNFAALAALVGEADAGHSCGASIRGLNIELHRRIIRLSGNPVLAAVGETVLTMLYDRLKPLESRASSGVALGLHQNLLEAFRARDAAAARAIMEKDIASLGRRFALLDAKGKSTRRKE